MKRLLSILLSGALCVGVPAGCASSADEPPARRPDGNAAHETSPKTATQTSARSFSQLQLEAKDLINPWDGDGDTPQVNANGFALRLTSALLEGAGGGNFVCSPYSVWLPLAALANATGKDHTEVLLKTLGAAGVSVGGLNRAASQMLYRLTNQRGKDYGDEYYNPLQIANAIFVDNKVALNRGFAQDFLDYYRGAAFNVDFQSSDAAGAANKWASDNTEGLITDIVQEFDPQTAAAIANAIYFSDRWSWEFDPEKTKEGVFHAALGDTKAGFMLREGDAQPYYEDGAVQAMPLYFQAGGSLTIIKPKNGDAAGYLKSLTAESFGAVTSNFSARTGKLLLPKFEIDSGAIRLIDSLKALGIPLFDKNNPVLAGVIDDYPLYISDAVQKAVIKVDEKGTTAAAVTMMMMAGTGMPKPTEPFEMVCDSPFVFVLCGGGGGEEILFTGVVNQP